VDIYKINSHLIAFDSQTSLQYKGGKARQQNNENLVQNEQNSVPGDRVAPVLVVENKL